MRCATAPLPAAASRKADGWGAVTIPHGLRQGALGAQEQDNLCLFGRTSADATHRWPNFACILIS